MVFLGGILDVANLSAYCFSANARMSLTAWGLGMFNMAMASSLVISKEPPETTLEGIKIDRLWLTMITILVASFGTSFGLPHVLPVGSPIAGALKTRRVHKGFSEVNRMIIGSLPIGVQSFEA